MPPPEISVKRFSGLNTVGPDDEGDLATLIVAENVQFGRTGIIEGRQGFNWVATFDTTGEDEDTAGAYIGQYIGESDVPSRFFQIGGHVYAWDPPSHDGININVTGTSGALSPGVQYAGSIFFNDGKHWNGEELAEVPDYPGSFGPIEAHNERVWCINDDRLYFSAVGNGESWPAANFIDVEPSDFDHIVELKSYKNRLYIFKLKSVWVLDTPGVPTSWTLRRLSFDSCFYNVVVEHEGFLYWQGGKGAYRYDGVNIQRISEPIQNIWDSQEAYYDEPLGPDTYSYTTAFDENVIFVFGVNRTQRILCFHTKLHQWTEWVFAWEGEFGTNPPRVRGIWIDEYSNPRTARGIYLFMDDAPRFFVAAAVPLDVDYSFKSDTTGSTTERHFHFDPVIQTKFADLGEVYAKKRVTQWMMEYFGDQVVIEQFDEELRTVSQTVNGVGVGETNQIRFRGIGYFRKISMRITLKGSISSITPKKWYIRGLYGRVKPRGQQIRNAGELVE